MITDIKTRKDFLQAKLEFRKMHITSKKLYDSIIRRKRRIKTDEEIFFRLEKKIKEMQNEIDKAEPQLILNGSIFK